MSGLTDQMCNRIIDYCENLFSSSEEVDGLRTILSLMQENSVLQDDMGAMDAASAAFGRYKVEVEKKLSAQYRNPHLKTAL